jgi:pimeloyl-ACP methyl ester esterase
MAINYSIDGKGEKTLFFIHGWAADRKVWQGQIEFFKKDCRVISVDLRGHGESPWVDTGNLLEGFTQDILDLCHELNLKKINFVAWSLAGYIPLELMKKAPDLVESLTFITSTPKFLNSADYRCGLDEPNLKLLEKKLDINANAALEEFRIYMFSQKEREELGFPKAMETLNKIPLPHRDALVSGLELLRTADFRQDLKSINKPTLIIAGEKDTVTPQSASEFLQQGISGSELVVFKDSGHAPFLTQPDKFNQVLDEWIKRR